MMGTILIWDGYFASPKRFEVGLTAAMCLIGAACWISREGDSMVIPDDKLKEAFDIFRWKVARDHLLRAGMLTKVDGGYMITTEMIRCRPHPRRKQPIPPQIRMRVFERDGTICAQCGSSEHPSIDHIWPESRGGPTVLSNLQVLCRPCNSRKGSRV